MFDFLSSLGREITSRYQTVIRDIKAKSGSFYDAYLDLQEASIKAIIKAQGVEYDESRTCGFLLRNEEAKNLFINTLCVPNDVYKTIQDRTAKVNHHKHHKSKHILAESVVVFMETYHQFMSTCCDSNETFDGGFFYSIFGEYERTNATLKQEKESLVSELEKMAKEKRLTDDQLRIYTDALVLSKNAEADLAEQNEALLQEISTLKSLKLSILDQKLNRTIDMLNDLQEYVVESRAVSLAVGYTIVGKDRIGSYIDLAKAEMSRSMPLPVPQTAEETSNSCKSSGEGSTIKKDDGKDATPYNVMDATTRPPKKDTIGNHIGEDPVPYLHSKNITVRPDEKDVSVKKKGLLVRSFALAFAVATVVICLFLKGWLKLTVIMGLLLSILISIEMICYVKNLKEISGKSRWILRKPEIELNEKSNTSRVFFSTRRGFWAGFVGWTGWKAIIALSSIVFLSLMIFEILLFPDGLEGWTTLTSVVLTAVAFVLNVIALLLFKKSPHLDQGRYICFSTEKGVLVRDDRLPTADGYRLEKNE